MPTAQSYEPVEISDDESEDDTVAFLTAPPRTYARPLAQVSKTDLQDEDGDGSETDSDGGRRKRKRKYTKKPVVNLPSWTRPGSHSNERRSRTASAKRGSTEDRSYSKDPDDQKQAHGYGSGFGSASHYNGDVKPAKRRERQLTPPPEVPESELARIREAVKTSIAPDTGLDEEEEEGDDMGLEKNGSHYRSSSPIPIPENKEMISVTVKMVADPLSLPEGASENAIRLYTKPRTIRTYKEGSLVSLWDVVAARINRDKKDIILVYDGAQILSMRLTPKDLQMYEGCEIMGYEKAHWERLEKEKREARMRLINGSPPPVESSQPDVAREDTPEAATAKRLKLSGGWGDYSIKVADTVKISSIAEYYCHKASKDAGLAGKIRLTFDGDVLDVDSTVGDLDVEDGDMIDVMVPAG